MTNILIVDDEPMIRTLLRDTLSLEGWTPFCVEDLENAHKIAAANHLDIVLLDIQLPDGSGLDAISLLASTSGNPEIIIITGYGHADAAGLAMEYGAWDYTEKPVNIKKVVLSIRRALEYRKYKLAAGKPRLLNRNGIVGAGAAINACLEQAAEAAAGDHSVLITGETGTGKELFARAIHLNSRRADKNFIIVDCASLTESLIESGLFGHVKGAFTSADRDRDGLIKLAHQGTLFLDEIGELPLETQKKFLRVLEEKRFRPVGGTTELTSDFRLIAATNRNLEEMTAAGNFRLDLFYRINTQKLELPPLRKRREDIPGLVDFFKSRICRRMDIPPKIIQPEFRQCLYSHDWPGNIRELANVLDQVICAAREKPVLFHKDLPMEIRSDVFRRQVHKAAAAAECSTEQPPGFPLNTPPESSFDNLFEMETERPSADPARTQTSWQEYRKTMLEAAEKKYFQRLLSQTDGDIDHMIRIADISKSRIYSLMHKHGLTPK